MRAKRLAQELRTEHPGPGLQPGLDLDFSALEYHVTTQKARNFTIACLVTWPFNGSEIGGNLALIQTSPLLPCKPRS